MKKSFLGHLRIYFREYCSHTSVHGFQYIGEKKRTIFERVWWLVVCCISLAACVAAIHAVYQKWYQSPVIVNFANSGTPIYNIPFPAVTVCPESKSDQTKFNFTKIMQRIEDGLNITRLEQDHFQYMSMICNYYPELHVVGNVSKFDDDFFEVIDELKPSFQLLDCIFLGVKEDCKTSFIPIITDEGICYTFNMLDRESIFRDNVVQFKDYHRSTANLSSSWTLQDGYPKDAGGITYPYRAFLAGDHNGLSFNILTPKQDLDYACKNSLQGYKVLLHTPLTIPRPRQTYFRIPLDQSVVGVIHPVVITTSNRIKMYSAKTRKCYFSTEHPLRFFKNYTASNCKLECLANFTYKICDCVDYFMPRDNETSVCGTANIQCLKLAEQIMHMMDLIQLLPEDNRNEIMKYAKSCNCLPICSDLTYEVETSQTDWEWDKWLRARRNLPRVDNKSHLSSITLFFQSDHFISSERNELYGPLDFLANFGGLLGLFTGFSVLSLMEMLYFATVRIFCNKKLYGQWSGENEA